MIIVTNSHPIRAIKDSWEILLEIEPRTLDESVLYEDPAIYEFLPYELPGFSLDERERLRYDFNILELFPEYDLAKIKEETKYWERELILNNRINDIVNHLKKNPESRRAMISIWNDAYRENLSMGAACIYAFYFRVGLEEDLEMHTHARANDLYNCVYVDLQFVNFIHRLIASRLGLRTGKHVHFVDALHIYKKDLDKVKKQTKFISQSEIWNKQV